VDEVTSWGNSLMVYDDKAPITSQKTLRAAMLAYRQMRSSEPRRSEAGHLDCDYMSPCSFFSSFS
jgi:hypothetical protein